MIELLTVIGAACLGVLVINFDPYQKLLLRWNLQDTKPFSCTMCLDFWLVIGYFLATNGIHGIFLAAAAAVLAELIDRKINNYE